MRTRPLLILTILLLAAAYSLPWVVTSGSSGQNIGLSFGAYDLAEWASLVPAVQSETPPLLTAFLLRAPLACLGLIAAFTMPRRWLAALVALIVAIALLPPPEFVRDPGNMNYRQQLGLAALTLIGGLVAASGVLGRYRGWIVGGIALLGLATTIGGLMRGYNLMIDFRLNVFVGLGGVMAAVLFGVLVFQEKGARR